MEKKDTGKKKKTIIIIACAAAGVLIAAVCFFIIKKYIDDHILDGGDMVNQAAVISVEYYLSPDEYGRSESIVYKDGSIKYYYCEGNGMESVKKECTAEADFNDSLENIIRQYDVASWQDLPESDIEVLDASTTSMNIEFANGTIVRLGYGYQMPDGAWSAVSEITDLMESYVNEHAD